MTKQHSTGGRRAGDQPHLLIVEARFYDEIADLLLDGIEILPPTAYARIVAFVRFAAGHGYPALR